MNKLVVYTAIFGEFDELREPKVVPEGVDFVCFTDQSLESKTWQVRKVERTEKDATRNARKYKILPHRFLSEYDISIWVDGNMLVRGDVTKFVEKYLKNKNIAGFNHLYARNRDFWRTKDARDDVYQELKKLISIEEKGRQPKDKRELMENQVESYRKEGLPEHHGLILSMILVRRHNEENIKQFDEAWWTELQKWSRRDQISFGYLWWKLNLDLELINENARNNKYFRVESHKKGAKR